MNAGRAAATVASDSEGIAWAVALGACIVCAFLVCILLPVWLAVTAVPEQLQGGVGVLDEAGNVSTFAGQIRRRSSFAMHFLETHPGMVSPLTAHIGD